MSLSADLRLARDLLEWVTGQEARGFFTYDFGRAIDRGGISVVMQRDTIWDALFKVRSQLAPGLIAFSGTRKEGFELVVGPGATQFDALRLARTVANERRLETEPIIERFQHYDAAMGIDIYSAETDTVVFQIDHLPEDLEWFVKDIKDLCPEFGEFTADSLANWRAELEKEKQVFIWWD